MEKETKTKEKTTLEDAKKRAEELFKNLTAEEKKQFVSAVENDFGCQWDDSFNREGIFRELYKILCQKKCQSCGCTEFEELEK